MTLARSSVRWLCGAVLLSTPALHAQAPAMAPLPLKYTGPATKPAITAGDLMTRLYIYADDSMMGRNVGTQDHLRATDYIEREVRRIGLQPAGDNGGYFQDIQVVQRNFDTTSTLQVEGTTYRGGVDFLALSSGPMTPLNGMQVLVWGSVFDTLNAPKAEAAAGKLVYVKPLTAMPPGFDAAAQRAFIETQGFKNFQKMQQLAGGVISIIGDQVSPTSLASAVNSRAPVLRSETAGPITLLLTTKVMDAILGQAAVTAPPGTLGKAVSAEIRFTEKPLPGRNVVAILPGSDARLKGQYVAIGAHNDHVGFSSRSRGESDSLKVWGAVGHPAGAEGGRSTPLTAEEWTEVNAKIAEMRKVYPARPDSIYNGADDDGSGTVSVLEIAEALAKGNLKPKRSILFVWHAGEEKGMWGSGYYMDHPTVPRDSIVAQLNIDMVGRGAATDVTGQGMAGGELRGGDKYVQLVGSRRLSTELGNLVETVNRTKGHAFTLDYGIDADGHPQNIYCRSDHWSYAKWGVPVVFFTTGGHADYHQVTDEPQFIRYDHMAALDQLILDITLATANLDHRVVVDGKKPNPLPAAVCQQ